MVAKAHVSEATTYPLPILPSANGRIPYESRTAIKVFLFIITKEKAPVIRGIVFLTASGMVLPFFI
jgi:hypothetical protein